MTLSHGAQLAEMPRTDFGGSSFALPGIRSLTPISFSRSLPLVGEIFELGETFFFALFVGAVEELPEIFALPEQHAFQVRIFSDGK